MAGIFHNIKRLLLGKRYVGKNSWYCEYCQEQHDLTSIQVELREGHYLGRPILFTNKRQDGSCMSAIEQCTTGIRHVCSAGAVALDTNQWTMPGYETYKQVYDKVAKDTSVLVESISNPEEFHSENIYAGKPVPLLYFCDPTKHITCTRTGCALTTPPNGECCCTSCISFSLDRKAIWTVTMTPEGTPESPQECQVSCPLGKAACDHMRSMEYYKGLVGPALPCQAFPTYTDFRVWEQKLHRHLTESRSATASLLEGMLRREAGSHE